MAPKTVPPANKLAACLKYFHTSAVAHSIKDLEKALPSVASINGMQVKDYLQSLSDDNKIHVEKIGSGNWYWAFPGEAKKAKLDEITKASEERDKAAANVKDLQAKVDEANAALEDDKEMLIEPGQDRTSLTKHHAELVSMLEPLKIELASYSDNDPTEMDKKRVQVDSLKQMVEKWTDQIQCMERHIRDVIMGGDQSAIVPQLQHWYGDQYDEEEQGLKDLG